MLSRTSFHSYCARQCGLRRLLWRWVPRPIRNGPAGCCVAEHAFAFRCERYNFILRRGNTVERLKSGEPMSSVPPPKADFAPRSFCDCPCSRRSRPPHQEQIKRGQGRSRGMAAISIACRPPRPPSVRLLDLRVTFLPDLIDGEALRLLAERVPRLGSSICVGFQLQKGQQQLVPLTGKVGKVGAGQFLGHPLRNRSAEFFVQG
jgi:hypothetical protein